jgi:Domain of unknown function (DUF1887)
MTTHILIVSNQAAANLLPTLDPKLKPSAVRLIVSKKMHSEALWLKQVFSQAGIKVMPNLEISDESNFKQTEEAILSMLAEYPEQETVIVNITGGTKLMALAAKSAADAAERLCIYVDIDTDHIIWLPDHEGKTKPIETLDQRLGITHYFKGYGFEVNRSQSLQTTASHTHILQELLVRFDRYAIGLSMLNAIGQRADKSNNLRVKLGDQERNSDQLKDLIALYAREKLLSLNDNFLTFKTEHDRSFATGAWLEVHTFNCVNDLRQTLQLREVECNLEVMKESVKNELDVTFLHRNRLYVLECKTSRMDWNMGEKANDALFKLSENARRVGGTGAKAMLVTYRELKDAELKLAHALNIKVVAGKSLARLKENIRQWVTP